jgi:hypothetical protein
MMNLFVSFMAPLSGPGLQPSKVTLSVHVAAENFEIVGTGRAEVDVSPTRDSPVVQIILRGLRVGRGRLMIDFSQSGVPTGSMDLEPEMVADLDVQNRSSLCAPHSGGLILNLAARPISRPQDLVIKVLEHRYAGQGGRLQFIVSSSLFELGDLPLADGWDSL